MSYQQLRKITQIAEKQMLILKFTHYGSNDVVTELLRVVWLLDLQTTFSIKSKSVTTTFSVESPRFSQIYF